jgi:tetratricopeptide (TPR) repeat protein
MTDPTSQSTVVATGGFAYGVVGADIHVFSDGRPLYVLENWRGPAVADPAWLRELPSRLLSTRYGVVPFTGREKELDALREWLRSGPRLAARWFHGPAGQGKSRLADQLAQEAAVDGWKVVVAIHGSHAFPLSPGSQDVRAGDAAGLLVVIDYADAWPLSHLAWLFGNVLLQQMGIPTRVLLLARTAEAWPAVRATLVNHGAGPSTQMLTGISESASERRTVFEVARNAFARYFDINDPETIEPPASLDNHEFALTLALHIAALAAVDFRANANSDLDASADLTAYLLRREQYRWSLMSDAQRLRTTPSLFRRSVYVASLTGGLPVAEAVAVLGRAGIAPDIQSAHQIIDDFQILYPSPDPSAGIVLEPLHPDRLGEDFVALNTPGHNVDYPADPWAADVIARLLEPGGGAGFPKYAPSALSFLVQAARRWPHLGSSYLFPLLRRYPQLALLAGGATLSRLAILPNLDIGVLEAIEPLFPTGRHADLDSAIADVVSRLTAQRLGEAANPAEIAHLYTNLGYRLANAGQREAALEPSRRSVEILEELADGDSVQSMADLASALRNLGAVLSSTGRYEEALEVASQAARTYSRLASVNPLEYERDYAAIQNDLGIRLFALGRHGEALEAMSESVALYRKFSITASGREVAGLAMSLNNIGGVLSSLGRQLEALDATIEAATVYRRLVNDNPSSFEPNLAASLANLGVRLSNLGRSDEARSAIIEAVDIYRRLAETDPGVFEPDLAGSLNNLGRLLAEAGRSDEARSAIIEAVDIYRQLAENKPEVFESDFADALQQYAVLRGLWE